MKICRYPEQNCAFQEYSTCHYESPFCPYDIIPPENDWLPDRLQMVKNIADIALLVHQYNKKLLPTVLEFLYHEAQVIMDEYCMEEK